MANLGTYVGANDNAPAWVMDSLRRETAVNRFKRTERVVISRDPSVYMAGGPILFFLALPALFWLVPSLERASSLTVVVGILAVLFAVWCGRVGSWRSRELSLLAAIAAFTLAIGGAASTSGIAIDCLDAAVTISAVSVVISAFFNSRTALLTSLFATIIWASCTVPWLNQIFRFVETASQDWAVFAPCVISAQIVQSMRMRSAICLLPALCLVYGWAIWLGVGAEFPPVALAGLGLIIGAAHFIWGRTLADHRGFGAGLHALFGVSAAVLSTHFIQALWLDPQMNRALPGWMPTRTWWIILGLAFSAQVTASLSRFKHSQFTLPGVFILGFLTMTLSMTSIRPDIVRDAFSFIPGLKAAPGFGLVLGGILMAIGLATIAKGLRDLSLIRVVIGAVIVGMQGVILVSPELTTLDLGLVFICSLIAALCVGGLVAGAALDHARPARRLV